jgi:hypothetical protein
MNLATQLNISLGDASWPHTAMLQSSGPGRVGLQLANRLTRAGMKVAEWGRPDRYLHVQNSDLFNKTGERFDITWSR